MKCSICGRGITEKDSHNGDPLVEGRVGSCCNWKVIRERLRRIDADKPKEGEAATESIAVLGTDGPVNVVDAMADFEKYAEEFEETFILGKTPVRKEKATQNIRIKEGEIVGEVSSMAKEEKAEQVEPSKAATESLMTYNELQELVKLCDEIGLDTIGDLNKFLKDNPEVDTLTALRKYRKELGEDFEIKKEA